MRTYEDCIVNYLQKRLALVKREIAFSPESLYTVFLQNEEEEIEKRLEAALTDQQIAKENIEARIKARKKAAAAARRVARDRAMSYASEEKLAENDRKYAGETGYSRLCRPVRASIDRFSSYGNGEYDVDLTSEQFHDEINISTCEGWDDMYEQCERFVLYHEKLGEDF